MRTLLMSRDMRIGVTEEEVKVGDIIRIQEDGLPFLVYSVLPASNTMVTEEGEVLYTPEECKTTCDQVAYLYVDKPLVEKYPVEKKGKHSTKKRSAALEKETAKQFGGQTVVASGAFDFHKGDIKTKDFLIEHKYTDKDYYSLKLSVWEKAALEAYNNRKTPLMEIVLSPEKDRLKVVVVALFDFLDYMGCTEEEFAQAFHMQHLQTDKKSIRIKKDFADFEEEAFAQGKLPAAFITFNGEVQLIMMKTGQFLRLIND